jgi:hypothetical protein
MPSHNVRSSPSGPTNTATHQTRRRASPETPKFGPDASLRNRRGARGTVVGDFFCFKTDQLIPFVSRLEMLALMHLSVSPRITRLSRNDQSIEWFDGYRLRKHTPDFAAVTHAGARRFVEVKSEHWLRQPETAWKFKVIAAQARQRGIHYTILTERHLHHARRLRNVQELNAYGPATVVDEVLVDRVRQFFADHAEASIERLSEALSVTEAAVRSVLMHLAAWSDLAVDLQTPITNETEFRRRNQ